MDGSDLDQSDNQTGQAFGSGQVSTEIARQQRHQSGDILIHRREPSEKIYLLLKGYAKIQQGWLERPAQL